MRKCLQCDLPLGVWKKYFCSDRCRRKHRPEPKKGKASRPHDPQENDEKVRNEKLWGMYLKGWVE